jgi:hypothetical protein
MPFFIYLVKYKKKFGLLIDTTHTLLIFKMEDVLLNSLSYFSVLVG